MLSLCYDSMFSFLVFLGISSWPWLNKLKLEGSLTMWQIVCNFSPSSMYYSPFPVVASFVQLSDKFSPEFLHGSYYGDDHPLFFSLILLLSLSSCSCYLSFQWSGVCTDLLSNVSSIATSHLPVMLSLLRNPVDTYMNKILGYEERVRRSLVRGVTSEAMIWFELFSQLN